MHKLIALLALTFLFGCTGVAEEQKRSACRFRFAVTERSENDRWGVWPEDARKWWGEEGKRKFPEFCETTSQDADFVIAWLRKQTTEKHSRPKRDETWAFPTLPANDCYTIPGQTTCYPGSEGQLVCETSPSQTICTPQPATFPTFSEWETYETLVERVSVTAYRVSNGQFLRMASFKKAGYFPTDRPGGASFRSAMKALKKKASKLQ